VFSAACVLSGSLKRMLKNRKFRVLREIGEVRSVAESRLQRARSAAPPRACAALAPHARRRAARSSARRPVVAAAGAWPECRAPGSTASSGAHAAPARREPRSAFGAVVCGRARGGAAWRCQAALAGAACRLAWLRRGARRPHAPQMNAPRRARPLRTCPSAFRGSRCAGATRGTRGAARRPNSPNSRNRRKSPKSRYLHFLCD
jgi:hypothetical protein